MLIPLILKIINTMIDAKLLRQNPTHIAEILAKRGFSFPLETYQQLENDRKIAQVDSETAQAKRKTLSQAIGKAKSKGEDTQALMAEVQALDAAQTKADTQLKSIQIQLDTILHGLPNLPDAVVPVGKDEADNQEVRRYGEPIMFDFPAKEHADLEHIGLNFQMGSKVAGARFTVLNGALARLHRALGQFMLDLHTTKHGYQETYVPYLANSESLFGTGQLPKFSEDLCKTHIGEREFYLIPTAEVSLTNLAAETIFSANELPKKLVAQTPCFRAEAGAHGRDVRGMIRQHQFEKVELVHFTTPDKSDDALETLTQHAEAVLQALKLPYRVMLLCTGDMGFSARKTYDIEVWLAGQQKYREISSCSNCGDFQARRMQARYRPKDETKPQFIHTLNGSGLAIGRTLVAILENYQNADGSITVPEVLVPYMNGLTKIELMA